MPRLLSRHRDEIVLGHRLPPPRVTTQGLWLFFLYLGAPTLLLLLAFDVVVWAVAWLAFDACVAVWCLF